MSIERSESAFPPFESEPVRADLGAEALYETASAYAPLFAAGELTAFLPENPDPSDAASSLALDAARLHLALASGDGPAVPEAAARA